MLDVSSLPSPIRVRAPGRLRVSECRIPVAKNAQEQGVESPTVCERFSRCVETSCAALPQGLETNSCARNRLAERNHRSIKLVNNVLPPPGLELSSVGKTLANHGQATINRCPNVPPPPGLELPSKADLPANLGTARINLDTSALPPPGLELPSYADILVNRDQAGIGHGINVPPPPGLELPSATDLPANRGQARIYLEAEVWSNAEAEPCLSDEMRAEIRMKLDSGMAGCKILEEFGPKWRTAVSAHLTEVGSCINAEMKLHIRMMLDSGMSGLEILNEFGPKWRASVSKYLDEAARQ